MARTNAEIKVEVVGTQDEVAARVGLVAVDHGVLDQRDAFLPIGPQAAPGMRAKIRVQARTSRGGATRGDCYFVSYERGDEEGASFSRWSATNMPLVVAEHLLAVLPTREVRKRRRLFIYSGHTRVHIDRVEGLGGTYLEIETHAEMLPADVDPLVKAEAVLAALGVEVVRRFDCAYLDLLGQ